MHIILDLDGTLIDGDGEHRIYPRPHLQVFLDFCFAHYESVSIWTAAPREWLELARARLFSDRPFRFLWSGERCALIWPWRGSYWNADRTPEAIKPLKKVWRRYPDMNRNNTMIVDDTPATYRRNYGNAIPIPNFNWSDRDDNCLLRLRHWLPGLDGVDLRSREKRYWVGDAEEPNPA
jgi:hypothetical protein